MSPIDAFIASGAWLFHKSTSVGSRDHLVKLHKQLEKERSFNFLRCHFGRQHLHRARKRVDDEKQCLESILFVFPNRDEDCPLLALVDESRNLPIPFKTELLRYASQRA